MIQKTIVAILKALGGTLDSFNYESITVADAAIGLTPAKYAGAVRAEITLETADIRYRKDGTDPASDEGHPVRIDDTIVLRSATDIVTFKAIRTGSTSGVLKVTYLR
jgi:hypothetical protein